MARAEIVLMPGKHPLNLIREIFSSEEVAGVGTERAND